MKISIVGTGYVGLVTGVCLADIGHHVICMDVDEVKIERLNDGISPIYEPGLEEMMQRNMQKGTLAFTLDPRIAFEDRDVIYIAVGTPEKEDGSADLRFVERAALDIAQFIRKEVIVVMKSTVPVGTNDRVEQLIRNNTEAGIHVDVVANPEFLKEGDAIRDSFHGDRIIIGSESRHAAAIMAAVNEPFNIPIYKTDRKSAEMVKYASNAFLATKISFINEISNICELVGADVEKVAKGMGMDKRIGSEFLKAGIGYGGSCFPKDTKALIQIAGNVAYDFQLLKGVVRVNKQQQELLMRKLNSCLPVIEGKRIAVLGLSFKPGTDDMREAASILVTEELIRQRAEVIAYDPVAADNARAILNPLVNFADSIEEALSGSDAALILTEWPSIKNADPAVFQQMKNALVLDGRNCFEPNVMRIHGVSYHSIGRAAVAEPAETLTL